MFENLVVGPIGTEGLGLVRRCLECRVREAAPGRSCEGFGFGCMSHVRTGEELPAAARAPLADLALLRRAS